MIPQIDTIPLQQLASGDVLCLNVYRYRGNPGKKAYIQANLHGAEIVGNIVIAQLIDWLSGLATDDLIGEICLVPLCNPLAVNQRTHFFATGRYNPYDGQDWNRIFSYSCTHWQQQQQWLKQQLSLDAQIIRTNYLARLKTHNSQRLQALNYTERFAAQLQSLCVDANYVIDLHSSSNWGVDHLYCFASRKSSAAYFGFDYGILMHECQGVSFDEAFLVPWLELEQQLATLGKSIQFDLESWTIELGSGMQAEPQSVARAVAGIQNYLAAKEMIATKAIKSHSPILVPKDRIHKYYASTGGMIYNRVELNTPVQKGQKLYQICRFPNQQLPQTLTVTAQTDGIVFDLSSNCAVNQGEYVLTILQLS